MPYFIHQYDLMTVEDQTDLHRATSIILEACEVRGRTVFVTSIDDAHEYGFFAFHLGFDDRPERKHFLAAVKIFDAVETLDILRRFNPTASVRLHCGDDQAQIEL